MEDKKVPENTQAGRPMLHQAEARMSARAVLLDHAHRLRRESERLERLANALPNEMHPDADEALWNLVVTRGR